MFQIEKNDYVIDAGWYNNIFITYLIYKYDWENPIITIKSDILKNCIFAIGLAIQYAEKIMNKNPRKIRVICVLKKYKIMQNMKTNLTVIIALAISIFSANAASPKKIKAKGDYTHVATQFVFPQTFESYQRTGIFAFDKKKENIGVTYETGQTKFSVYIYPAGDGDENRLRYEYRDALMGINALSKNGLHATQGAVKHVGEKYICNGFKAEIHDKNKFNFLTVYECGKWFFKLRITSNDLDSVQISTLGNNIYAQFDPSKLTALEPFESKSNIHFARGTFRDSVLLGSAMGSAFEKVKWAIDSVPENERTSGFLGMYLKLQVAALKAFMEFQHRESMKNVTITDFTKKYLAELQMISDTGFLNEFVMEQFDMLLIFPENMEYRYDDYLKWKSDKNLTIDLNGMFYVIVYKNKS